MVGHFHHLVAVMVTGILSGTKHGHGPACGHYQDDSCLVLNRMMVRNFAGIEVSTNSKHLPSNWKGENHFVLSAKSVARPPTLTTQPLLLTATSPMWVVLTQSSLTKSSLLFPEKWPPHGLSKQISDASSFSTSSSTA